MRISDWNSDVCSSDLVARLWDVCGLPDFEQLGAEHHSRTVLRLWQWRTAGDGMIDADFMRAMIDRKSVVQGKRVSVRVVLGGRRNIQKKNEKQETEIQPLHIYDRYTITQEHVP